LLTIVIPTLNELKLGYLPKILDAYKDIPECEILCVDGGSDDGTCQFVEQTSARLISNNIVSRAGRLNEGIRQASFDLVLLHHPRSILTPKAIYALIQQSVTIEWGAFTHRFDLSHPLLSFTSWYSNIIRGDWRGIYYLDHCIFAQKKLLVEVGLLPDVDIFEDTKLCLRLRKRNKGKRLAYISQTSAVRFVSRGIYRQALKNQYLKWQYYFNISDRKMNQSYENKLPLNSKYSQSNSSKTGQR
jgi:glycosyltransferase involved in cell wall biosynthesis